MNNFKKDLQYYKFCLYGFLKNQRFFEPFFILFLLEKGFTYIEIGTVYTIREITRNIFEIPAGFGADALGRRKAMIAAFTLYIASFTGYYFFSSLTMIIVSTMFFALGDAFRTGTHKAMIFDYLKINGWADQKVHYYGHTRSWSQIGSALSSLIAAVLVFFSGTYETIFLYSSIPYLAGLFLMISYPAYLDGNIEKFDLHSMKFRFIKVWKEFLSSIKDIQMLRAIINISSYSGYYRAIKDYLQPVIVTLALSIPLMKEFGENQRSAVFIGLIYFFIYLLTSSAARNSGKISDLFAHLSKPLNITLITGLVLGIITGLLVGIKVIIPAVTLFVVIYIIENIRRPMGVSYISEILKQDILATALSTEEQGKTILSAGVAFLMGILADRFGVGWGLVIVSGLLIIPAPFFLLRKKE